MNKVLAVIDALSEWSGKVFSLLPVVVICIINYEVVARYVFNAPTDWAQEAMTIVGGIYFVMGGAYTLLLNGHVSVDVIYVNLPRRVQALLDVLNAPLIFLYFAVIMWTGGVYAWESWGLRESTGSAADLPFYPLKISFFVAAALMSLQLLAKLVRDFSMLVFEKEL